MSTAATSAGLRKDTTLSSVTAVTSISTVATFTSSSTISRLNKHLKVANNASDLKIQIRYAGAIPPGATGGTIAA